MDNTNPSQVAQATDAYHYAIAAAGGLVDGVATSKRTPSTRTQFIIAAWGAAKLAGLKVKRPRGPVDGAEMARSIRALCEAQGIDAATGASLAQALAVAVEEELAPVSAVHPCADDEELVPEPHHRCKDADGYCPVCLVDLAA